jgi:hypothetical protein
MFREAIGYPTRPPEGGRSVIVGGLLFVVAAAFVGVAALGAPYGYLAVFGLLPWVLVRGYYVRVVRTTIGRERPTPPRFDDVRGLFRDGLIAAAVSVAYLSPGIAVLGPLVAIRASGTDLSTLLSGQAIPGFVSVGAVSAAGIAAVVAVMYVIGALYVLPVAIARYAHTGDPRAAFELRTVVSGATTEDYVIAWAVSLVMQVFLLPVAYLLQVLLVGFFLQFVVSVGVRYCYGQGVGAALGLDPVPAAHERSDPDEWELWPAVRRVEPLGRDRTTTGERVATPDSERAPEPGVRRRDDRASDDRDRPRR